MRFSTIAVVAFSGLAAAQSTIPACGKPCIDAATKSETTCSATDLACQCTTENKLKIQTAATTCVLTACGDQAISVLNAANADCAALGDESPPIVPSSTSVTVVDTASVTGTISISIIESTALTTLTSTSTIEAPTGTPSPRPGTNGTVVTNSTSTVTGTATVILSSTSTASRTSGATTSPTSSVAPGAAGKMVVSSVGGVLAFALALFAGL